MVNKKEKGHKFGKMEPNTKAIGLMEKFKKVDALINDTDITINKFYYIVYNHYNLYNKNNK